MISHMTQLLTKHSLCSINIQAREVRKIVQSALWLVRQQGTQQNPIQNARIFGRL